MPRSAFILSCAIHGSVLALLGWVSLSWMPRMDMRRTEVKVSFSPGDSALVTEEPPAPVPTPDVAAAPAETSFTPPAPTIPPTPVPEVAVENTPSVISTTSNMPPKMPSLAPAKRQRVPHTASASTSHRGAMSGVAASGLNTGGGGGSGYVPPQYLLRFKPPYPEEARAQRLEGVVVLLVSVDAEGHVTSVSLRQGCGHAMLDHAALDAVHSWRFNPARQDGRAIPATVEVPIRFNFSA